MGPNRIITWLPQWWSNYPATINDQGVHHHPLKFLAYTLLQWNIFTRARWGLEAPRARSNFIIVCRYTAFRRHQFMEWYRVEYFFITLRLMHGWSMLEAQVMKIRKAHQVEGTRAWRRLSLFDCFASPTVRFRHRWGRWWRWTVGTGRCYYTSLNLKSLRAL